MIKIKIATPQNAAKIRKNLVPPGSSLHSFPVYFLTRSHPSFVVTIAAYMIAVINVFMCFVLAVKNEANVETSAVMYYSLRKAPIPCVETDGRKVRKTI